jgi:hypothetical protein
MGGQILLDEPWPVRAGCCGIYFFCSFPRFSQCLWRRQWQGGDPWRAMGGYAPRAAPLAVAPQALHCASQEQKKCRGKRQPLAAARARPPRKIPPWSVPASRPGAVAATEPTARSSTQPPVKDQWNDNPLRPGRGLGVPNPQGMRQPTPAPPGTSVRLFPCTRSACSRRPQAGRTAYPHGGAAAEQRTTRMLASPCMGASGAGGSLRGASATCALQLQLVPRRQSEAGASRLKGADRHGGRQRRPRWSWKAPFEIERLQGHL